MCVCSSFKIIVFKYSFKKVHLNCVTYLYLEIYIEMTIKGSLIRDPLHLAGF